MHSPPRRVALIAALVLVGAVTAALPARAAEDSAASAREHYQKGTTYYDLGKYTEAIKEFEAAYEIKNDPALLFNLAQSHRLAGNAEQALHFYRTYLRRVPKAPNRSEIEAHISALEQQIAQKSGQGSGGGAITPPPVTSPTTTGGTTTGGTTTPPPPPGPGPTGPVTTLTPPPETPPPGPLPPTGTAGTLTTSPPPAPPPATASANYAHKLKLVGVVSAATGGVLVVIGAIEGSRAAGAANEINNAAKAGKAFDPSVESRGLSAQRAERGFLIGGLLLAAAGGGLYLYGRHVEPQAPTVTVGAVATPREAGAVLRVTF